MRPPHTAKTHSCEALSHAAVDTSHKVIWFSLERFGALVGRYRADDTSAKATRRIMRADVIVIDDIGLLPVTAETAEAALPRRAVASRHDRSNLREL